MADALEQKFSNGHTRCIILTLHRLGERVLQATRIKRIFIATEHNGASRLFVKITDRMTSSLFSLVSNVANRHRYRTVNYRIRVSFTIEVKPACTR